MKARFSYPLVFLLPNAMVAAIAAFVAAGLGGGILWLFVYGDDTWPQTAEYLVMGVAILASLATLTALSFASYSFGKRREASADLSWLHIALAVGISMLLPALALLHQLSVGNIGPQPDSLLCSDFCTAKKFGSSRFPQDGTCRCNGADGNEALNVSMDSVRAKQP
ncbi:hypothetical protein [Lysobacter sp. CFH 32150]|uniref:hypothetical protein n=1 Tax=Lysobacter sp. CFH 32150 TaxID=2927128 RepID=UPI001FA7B40A|nr:hypothetical protein [Lysobacter sp. CFH 32150]MCI4569036.1 hypothetical protein [Lysobacter sp. CFH 32150]